MRIQDGHFGALSWRIKQIIGLSRRNTKEGSHETGTKRQRQHGTFCRSITYHTILCFYLYSCHGRPNTPHATCHTAPSRLDQHFLYWLRKKRRKSKQAKRANGLKRRTGISRNFPSPRRKKRETAQEMAMVWSVRRNCKPVPQFLL